MQQRDSITMRDVQCRLLRIVLCKEGEEGRKEGIYQSKLCS